jgi:hypothetical protein
VSEAQGKREPEPAVGGAKPRCKGTTRAGKPCASTVLVDGEHCLVHSSRGFDPVEAGRKGGLRSALARRALSKNEQRQAFEGRERLREQFEADPEFYEQVKAVYREALEAITTCPSCKERARPDHRTRIAAGDSFLAQLYGKPRQDINQSVTTQRKLVIAVPDWYLTIHRDRLAAGERPLFGDTELVPRDSPDALPAADAADADVLDYDELTGGD